MGCLSTKEARCPVEVVGGLPNNNNNNNQRSNQVVVQQAEGFRSVRVYRRPLQRQPIMAEIPSGEIALRFEDSGGFTRVQWRQVEGWVGKKNVRPLYSNSNSNSFTPPPAAVPAPQPTGMGLAPAQGGSFRLPTQQARPQASADVVQALAALAALQMLGDGVDAFDAPMRSWNQREGFHIHCDIRTVSVDDGKRRARCLAAGKQTVFTEEFLQSTDSADFRLKVVNAKGGPIFVGICPKVPNGYTRYAIGEKEFQNTLGAILIEGTPTLVCHEGEMVGAGLPAKEGDIVGFRFRRGTVDLTHNNTSFFQCQVSAEIRGGFTMTAEGQVLQIVP